MIRQRILLSVLLAWALVMIVPDVLRVVQPLASFGFYADSDGLIYDTGPFDAKEQSPAWNAGIRAGDRLAIKELHCHPYEAVTCRNALMLLGGHQFVLPWRTATLPLKATSDRPAQQITLVAVQAPANPFERFVVLLDQVAGILVVVAAAWLVWTRPSAMSWGFFLYVMWFNPGQIYAFYALLQQRPLLLLAQNLASARRSRRLCWAYPFRLARAGQRARSQMALARTRVARHRRPASAVNAGFIWHAHRLSLRDGNAPCRPHRFRRRHLRRRNPARANAAEAAGGLPAPALGNLGMRDRTSRLSRRRARLNHHDLRNPLGRLYPIRRNCRAALPCERHLVLVRIPGRAPRARGERGDPTPPRDNSRPHLEHSSPAAAPRGRIHAGASCHSELGVDRDRCGRTLSHLAPA
jgi:hypothetical protein